MKRTSWVIAAVVAALLLPACGGPAPREAATPTPILEAATTTKPTYVVTQGGIAEELRFSGRIAPVTEETLFFRTDGRVSTVNAVQGAMVKKGDLLAELDLGDLLNQLAQAEIALQTAQLKLNAAEQNVSDQRIQLESALRTAKLRLAQAQAKDPTPGVRIAEGNRDKATAALSAAQAAYDAKKLRPDIAALPESVTLQQRTIDYEIAQAQYEQALQSIRTWEYDLLLLQEAVTVAEANVKKLTTAIDPALAQDVARNQLAVERIKNNITNARIYAPFDGEITALLTSAGKTIQAYRSVLTIAAPGALDVSADLLSSTVQQLSVGQKCLLTMTNYPSRVFNGVIRRIPSTNLSVSAEEVDRSTRISVTDADVQLERGALVRVTVILQQKDKVLLIPLSALRSFQGKDFVLVLEGDIQRRVPVTVGIRSDEQVEILEGLTAGQIVVGP